jgi:hypothetical protein
MIAKLGRWEISGCLSEPSGSPSFRISRFEATQPEVPPNTPDLEQIAGEFIGRHVLEKDSVFFEG